MILRNTLEEAVEEVLAPYLGSSMARAATEGHCRQLGIDGTEMTEEQLEALVGRLTLGLHIFVGRSNSAQLATALRDEIVRRGEAP